MAEGISARVNVAFEGMEKNTELMASQLTQLTGMARTLGVIAVVWQTFDIFLRPILQLLKAILIMLFYPLIPLLKPIMQGMASAMKKIADAQKKVEEGGGGMLEQFMAGMVEALKVPSIWMVIGGLIAAGMITGLGGKTLLGAILLGLSLSILWDVITKGSEKSLVDILKSAGWAGLSVGLAALMFGAGVWAIPIGLLVFEATLGIGLISKGMKEGDLWAALKEIAAGSLALGIVTGAIASLFLAGGGAAVVGISLGTIVFSVFAGIKIQEQVEKTGIENKWWYKLFSGKLFGGIGVNLFGGGAALGPGGSANSMIYNLLFKTDTKQLEEAGKLIGSPAPGSFPLVYSLNTANLAWTAMADNSKRQINGIIVSLNQIPREIVTTHKIITVYSTKK